MRVTRLRAPSRHPRAALIGLVVCAALLALGQTDPARAEPTAASPGPAPAVSCRAVRLPVSVSGIGAATIGGTLCTPAADPSATIEVLVSGLTYDQVYWELPPSTTQAGYVPTVTRAGFATLAIDRLGTGLSTWPAASTLTWPNQLAALHQVITTVHSGTLGTYRHVVLVGHSFGSGLAVGEAGTYGDVDGIVLSGWAHSQGTAGTSFSQDLVDARTDPVTGRTHPPAGYLTTEPGVRPQFFYAAGDATTLAERLDEDTKSTLTDAELDTLEQAYSPTLAADVHVPVLVAIGSNDVLTCGTTLTCSSGTAIGLYESALFTGSPKVTGFSLPGAGHSINLAANAGTWYAAADQWTAAVAGTS